MSEPLAASPRPLGRHPHRTRRIAAWASYDWANSAFTTIVVTFLYPEFFRRILVPQVEGGTPGATLWAWAVSTSAVVVAVLSPILGAMADRAGRRRFYLIVSTWICVVFTFALFFVAPSTPQAVALAIVFFVVANSAFDLGGVFYNSFLPVVSPPEKLGTVSGIGWGLGYTAGIVSMVIALFAMVGLPGVIVPWLVSIGIIVYTFLQAKKHAAAGRWFVAAHWRLATSRYKILLIAYVVGAALIGLGWMLAHMQSDPRMGDLMFVALQRVAIAPILISLMVLIMLESGSLYQAERGEVPDE